MKYDYNELVNKLQSAVVTVTFNKVDGTERVMRCTLQNHFLPEEYRGKAPMLMEQAPVTLSVWDCDAHGWRSFRLDNVTNVA
jgi:hypothetical protein